VSDADPNAFKEMVLRLPLGSWVKIELTVPARADTACGSAEPASG
jgi:hypothetical protein